MRTCTPDVDFVVLPEHFLGDPCRTPPGDTTGDEALETLSRLARKLRVHLVTGSWLEGVEGGRVNVTRLLDRRGEPCATLRRPYGTGEPTTGDDFPIADTDKGKVGLLCGQDFWAIEATRIQSLRGAELVLVPGTLNARNRESKLAAIWGIATLSCVAVAFASAVGGCAFGPTGGSAIALPNRFVGRAGEEPGSITGEWSDDTMSALRDPDLTFKNTLWFGLWARRPELYGSLIEDAGSSGAA